MIDDDPTAIDAPARQSARSRVVGAAEAFLRQVTLPSSVVVGVVTTVPGNWLRVQNVDPMFSMVLVQRTIHFGGTFFDNAVQDHGPIEPFLYDIAARVGGRNGAWYVISAMVTLVSLVLAYVAAQVARFTGAAREVAIFVGAAVFIHFTISRSNYAGVLYIRNMTTCLLTLAWLLGDLRARVVDAARAHARRGGARRVAGTRRAELVHDRLRGGGCRARRGWRRRHSRRAQ